jgi:hypothetical protein
MGRRSISWLVVGVFTLALTLQPAGAEAQAPQRGVYLALGDSLAVGIGATDPAQLGYVPRLFHFLHGTAHGGVATLANYSRPGETSETMISGGQLGQALADIQNRDVRVVTLDIGANDFLTLLQSPPCSTDPMGSACQLLAQQRILSFSRAYTQIVSSIRAALGVPSSSKTFMVMTYYNFMSGTNTPLEQAINRVLLGTDLTLNCQSDPTTTWGVNDVIACSGMQNGTVVVDVYPRFLGKGPTLTDAPRDFHPTNAGYAMIANTFMRASR